MTADDIQKLINAPMGPDGTIEVTIEAGDHTLNKPLRLKPGVRLQGETGSEPTVLRADNPEKNILEFKPGVNDKVPHDIQIRDLHLIGPRKSDDITDMVSQNTDHTGGCGILFYAKGKAQRDDVERVVEKIIIERCIVENASGCGIRFDTREDVLMRDIEIRDCKVIQSGRTAESSKDPAPASFKDILFYGTRFENITIERNKCLFTPTDASRYGNDAGIAFVGNGRVVGLVHKTKILNNTCSGHRRHGLITNYGKMVADDVEVRGNTCRDNRWAGIYVNTSGGINKGKDVVIVDNTCEHNGYGGLTPLVEKTDAELEAETDAPIRGGHRAQQLFQLADCRESVQKQR